MKATYVQKGENINYKNPTEDKITLGTLIIIGAICAVAADDIEPGEIGTVATTGSWNVPKDNTAIETVRKSITTVKMMLQQRPLKTML